MRGFISLAWPATRETAGRRLLDQVLHATGWRLVFDRADAHILVPPEGPMSVWPLADGRGVVVGDLFRRGQIESLDLDDVAAIANISVLEVARILMRGHWGRYVALLRDHDGAPAIFRDPSGALDCVTWAIDGVRICASHLPLGLLEAAGPSLSLDWDRIALLLADPGRVGGALALGGLEPVAPGALWRPEGVEQLWSPVAFAARPIRSEAEARDGLVRAIDACVGAYATRGAPILAEISGGLDSAIVAAAVRRVPEAKVVAWLNYFAEDPWGDERPYARAIAERLGVALIEAQVSDLAVDPLQFGPAVESHRPCFYGLDAGYDLDVSARGLSSGAQMMLTGAGGDILFYQQPTTMVAVDYFRAHGLAAFASPAPLAVARWTKSSVWLVWRQMASGRSDVRALTAMEPAAFIVAPPTLPASDHPWLSDLATLPPAKQAQVLNLTAAAMYAGDCRHARALNCVHPLLSQPVIEHCLSIPADLLTQGFRDRALARAAFADRLPAQVISRRSKGDLTAMYGRRLAAGLEALRPHLLEGRLAERGLIDRQVLDVRLDPDQLVWQGGYGHILYAAFLESWVRHWESRLANLTPRSTVPLCDPAS